LKLNFKHFNLDDAIFFVKKVGKIVVYRVVYVDDMFITWNNENYIASIKKELKKGFEMTYLGHLHYYLGIEVIQNPKYIFISQKKYIGELFNKFGMDECNHVSTPMEQNLKLTSKEGNEFEYDTVVVIDSPSIKKKEGNEFEDATKYR
jgi:hypothetical protein